MRRTPSLARTVLTALTAVTAAVGLALPSAAAAGADTHRSADPRHPSRSSEGALRAQHSLRGANTDQNFYFVMGDRFANGSTANDTGGLGSDPAAVDPVVAGLVVCRVVLGVDHDTEGGEHRVGRTT